uniref:Lipoxygenase domain-containing protein n=1 Tax=Cyprinus carpio TaxID=7962 RepID=A0A8C1SVS5_CYPCA
MVIVLLTGSRNYVIYNRLLFTLLNKCAYCALFTLSHQEAMAMSCLGPSSLLAVKLEKEKHLMNFPWFSENLKVKTPSGDCFEFPCYRWLVDDKEVIIREGTGTYRLTLLIIQFLMKWKEWSPGFPMSIDAKVNELPKDVQFDGNKQSEWDWDFKKHLVPFSTKTIYPNTIVLRNEHFFIPVKPLTFDSSFPFEICTDNVMQDWNKDYMFGYQFLNGCNPVMIRKCMKLPDKFPVTHEMVKGCLKKGSTLQEQLWAGNIYIVDYEILNGVPAASSERHLTAPICLLYKNELDQIVPIAIQLSQTPGEMSPIFLPRDNKYDWMLAKMWVRSSDFLVHQLVTHLLKTHLLSEVFEMAMYRQLSAVHPVYKLLMPHVRFTIAINAKAREKLISKDGIFSQVSSINGAGMGKLIQNAMKTLTYESLCFPEDIKARGMEDVPKYYYRDDGKMVWKAIHCFVSAVIKTYYRSDKAVQKDVEIQEFVKDVACFDFPKSLSSREQLVEYLTAVIFTASAQHAAVNFGQFDWYGWIPNSPSTMRKPPPQQKGQVDLKYIMESLPDRECSSKVLGTVWSLTRTQENELYLGTYPDMYFTEQPVKEAIKTFRHKLDEVTNIIKSRNEKLTLGYCYLSPDKIPNSVAI